ncbi:MAG TPA: hypothetical protein VFY44_08200 [Thermoleophilaceae bacterium]|nr:hypothetical protein [Thermoleophilaceae bacterium]
MVVLIALVTAFSSASVQAAKPLALHPRLLTAAGPPPQPRAFAGRYVVTVADGYIRLTDDETGRRYTQSLPRSECYATDVRFPELLLGCRPRAATDTRPKILNMLDGSVTEFRDATEYPTAFGQPFEFGVLSDDSFSDLGSRWIGGTASDLVSRSSHPVYVDRLTQRRVNRSRSAPVYDLDSPDLSAKRQACAGPGRTGSGYLAPVDPSAHIWLWLRTTRKDLGGDLFIQRCGGARRLVSRCPSGCQNARFTNRFVTWVSSRGANVRSRRTGRAYTLREAYGPVQVSATDRRMLVSSTGWTSTTSRTVEIPLPASIR